MNILVIGYGNTLRGDDAVGPLVAEQVATWNWPGVRSLPVQQLTPELAAELTQLEIVFFIDASLTTDSPRLERIYPTEVVTRLDHAWSPGILLQLAKLLYDAAPIAYQLLIPARQFDCQFDYGQPLSAIAQNGLDWAVATLHEQMYRLRSTVQTEVTLCLK
jgi:hydrogenase maturation protease